MSKFFILTILFCGVQVCFAQTEVLRKNKITGLVTEEYKTLITSDKQIRNGSYQAMYKKKVVLAQGNYANDKRVGLWRFFDRNQFLTQIFNYDSETLVFEAPEEATSNFRYVIDPEVTDSTVATKPYRVGGRYFGYLPYMRFFKVPADLSGYDKEDIGVVMELFISPMGRLADFKLHVTAPYYSQTFTVDVNRLFEEDRKFFPATFNKEPISSRIFISCYVSNNGDLDMD